jgi:hypothetical protein
MEYIRFSSKLTVSLKSVCQVYKTRKLDDGDDDYYHYYTLHNAKYLSEGMN